MEFLTLTKQEYQDYFDLSEYKNFWQSVEMAQMREHKGWTIHYVGVKENGILCCACALESMKVYRDYRLFMALRGFMIDYHDEKLLRFFLSELKKYLKEHKCMYMKFDPYIAYQPHDIHGNTLEGADNEDALIALFEEYGFQHQGFRCCHDDDWEPRWMSILDVQGKSDTELLKQMQSMTRRNISFTEKNGIRLKTLKREELSILNDVVEETGSRRNFHQPDLTYYENIYDYFGNHMEAICAYLDLQDYMERIEQELSRELVSKEKTEAALAKNPEAKKTVNRLHDTLRQIEVLKKRKEEAAVLQKEHGNEIPLAASLFVKYPNEIIYLFGGSYKQFHQFKGSYAIQWHMIQETRNSGIPRYNFYGLSGNFEEGSEDYGVYIFKKGFHAEVIELLGDFIYVGNASSYRQYQALRKIKHTLLRR